MDALDGVPYLTPWAFEYTPPSSIAADTTYLRHVREADFVIWLAGPEVTEPVVNEVREAISANRRVIERIDQGEVDAPAWYRERRVGAMLVLDPDAASGSA